MRATRVEEYPRSMMRVVTAPDFPEEPRKGRILHEAAADAKLVEERRQARAEHQGPGIGAAHPGYGDGACFASRVGGVHDGLGLAVEPVLEETLPRVETQHVVMPDARQELPRAREGHGEQLARRESEEALEVPDQPPVTERTPQGLPDLPRSLASPFAGKARPREDALPVGERGGIEPELDGEIAPDGPRARTCLPAAG